MNDGASLLAKLHTSDRETASRLFPFLATWNEDVTATLRRYSHNNWMQRYDSATFTDAEPHDGPGLASILSRKLESLRVLMQIS